MEHEIVHTALENLRELSGIEAEVLPGSGGMVINLCINNQTVRLNALVQQELRQYHLPQIWERQQQDPNLLVAAGNIFPKIKKQLREAGTAYLESNGNIFLKTQGMYIFVETDLKDKIRSRISNRAFTKTGLKVVFGFLLNPDLINQPYREIAEETKAGLGTISHVVEGLKTTGYLIALNKNSYVWNNKKELIERWISHYATELRPTLFAGSYKLPEAWRELALNAKNTVWGGEPAAELLTNYLRPEKFIIHTTESKPDLMKNYKLIPDKGGPLEVYKSFWSHGNEQKTAPPLLVYAELMLEGGKRNKETADLLFERYVGPKL